MASFKDPDLQSLSFRLQTSILSARAPGTVTNYERAFNRWKDFALSKQELSYFPAEPFHVAVYLQHVLESTRSRSSVDSEFIVLSGRMNRRVSRLLHTILQSLGCAKLQIEF